MISATQIDDSLTIIDEMPKLIGWAPSIKDLESHQVDNNFEKYANFLLYLSESLEEEDATIEEEEAIKADEAKKYINKLFQQNVQY